MIELPEALNLARQLKNTITGKTVSQVLPPSSPHKFCWFSGDPALYDGMLKGKKATGAEGFGIFAEIIFGDTKLHFHDGVNIRYFEKSAAAPEKYQLKIEFTDGAALVFTVAMYGGIVCHDGGSDNKYYLISKNSVSPLSEKFDGEYFNGLVKSVKPGLSMKAFLATEQRIPGLANGTLQDILLVAGLNPKRKIGTLSEKETAALVNAVKAVLADMTQKGGRDTEKDLLGNPGGYKTMLSKNSLLTGCPRCGGYVTKEAYMGGAVYYCKTCQPV